MELLRRNAEVIAHPLACLVLLVAMVEPSDAIIRRVGVPLKFWTITQAACDLAGEYHEREEDGASHD
jgi:hypothetical protein